MAFEGYNTSFPYSDITQRMMSLLPRWMKMSRDESSIGQQFMNAAVGIELENLNDYMNELLNNHYIGRANIGQISWIYKASYESNINAHTELKVIGKSEESNNIPINIVDSIREFYEASSASNIGVFDYEKKILYTRKNYNSINIGGEVISVIELHHVWNSFDEIGLMVGLMRYLGESNKDFKERIMNAFRYPGDSTRTGLIRYIAGQLGLTRKAHWPANEDSIEVPDAIPGTIKIGSEFIPDGQIVNKKINPVVPIYPRDEYLEYKNTRSKEEAITLLENAVSGSVITPVIYPGNLDEWDEIIAQYSIPEGTKIKYRVLDSLSRSIYEKEISESDVPFIKLLEEPLSIPIRLELILIRNNLTYDSPSISLIELTYKHNSSDIEYISEEDISLDVLFDEGFKRSLFNQDGSPTGEMKNLVAELSDIAPILWDKFLWDEAYWDVVGKNLMGLDVLPNKWDAYLNIGGKYAQTGIGDRNDLLTEVDKDEWRFNVSSGFYYIGENLGEHYVYAEPGIHIEDGPTSVIEIEDVISSGSPIHIKATTLDDTPREVYLTQVSFLDDSFEYSIDNREVLTSKDGKIYASYAGIDIENAIVRDIETGTYLSIDENEYDGENVITLEGEFNGEVEVIYSVRHSFVVKPAEGKTLIELSDEYSDIEVTYESGSKLYFSPDINLSPLVNHIDQGFLYITDKSSNPRGLDITVSPDTVMADGSDRALIIIDVNDEHGNPAFVDNVFVSIYGELDEDKTEVNDPGVIELSDTHYNRHIYRYTSPEEVDGPSTIYIEVSVGDIAETVEIKAR